MQSHPCHPSFSQYQYRAESSAINPKEKAREDNSYRESSRNSFLLPLNIVHL